MAKRRDPDQPPKNHELSQDAAPRPTSRHREMASVLEAIRKSLDGLKYGQVIITVQDGVVVQIDRTERNRLV